MNSSQKPKLIAVIGPAEQSCNEKIYNFGLELGKRIIDENFWIVCGGKGGLMEAVCKGGHQSENYTFGCTIGIIPEEDRNRANDFCDVVIPTGMSIARNFLVVNAGEKVVAIAGGSGTLSEIAIAWQLGRDIIALEGEGGWSEELSNRSLSSQKRPKIQGVRTVEDIIKQLKM